MKQPWPIITHIVYDDYDDESKAACGQVAPQSSGTVVLAARVTVENVDYPLAPETHVLCEICRNSPVLALWLLAKSGI